MKKFETYLIYTAIFLFLLLWIAMLFYILNEIIGGKSGFAVACIGTLFTLYGVKKSLDHRNMELYLDSAKERLLVLEELMDTYENILDEVEKENSKQENSVKNANTQESSRDFYNKLINSNLEELYKYMEYNSIVKLKNILKKLKDLYELETFDDADATVTLEVMQEVYLVLNENKNYVEEVLKIKID